jgi:diguanylate cyclase (GGDEF)-like protein/PAS domain S-box-containing protein
MVEIIIPSLYILIGVCAYASFIHFSVGFYKPLDSTQIMFAGACLSVMLFAFFHIQALQAVKLDEFVFALRWSLVFSIIIYGCLIWFVALYSNVKPLLLLKGFALTLAVLFVVNLIQPYSLQYDNISYLYPLRLPWGETITLAKGHNSVWFIIAIVMIAVSLIYMFYAFGSYYLGSRKRVSFGKVMLLVLVFFAVCITEGILVRLSIVYFSHLGVYGFLGLLITISLILSFENRKQLSLAKLVFDASVEAMMVTDIDNNIIVINPAFTEMTGYTLKEVIGRNPNILSSGRHDNSFFQAMWEAINTTGKWRGEIWNRRKNGEAYPERLSINTLFTSDGSVYRRVALSSDITKDKDNDEMIWKQANFDDLTGLLNRRMANDRLEQAIKKSSRSALPIALMLIDLDRFKEVNDSFGHELGDNLLKEAGQRMKSCILDTDALGRLGGDEFVIILEELEDVTCVELIANKLLKKLAAPYRLVEESVYTSASIGITIYPEDAQDLVTLMQNVDQAMYAAKRQGRNCFHYYTPEMQEAANVRARISNDLHIALESHQFKVYYQPIVDLGTGYIRKAEALIRWQHPRFGLISPGDFIPIAEDTDQIIEIGDWVFHQAATEVVRIRLIHDSDFQISVNMSPVQFRRDSNIASPRLWFAYLKKIGLPGLGIVLEITEGLLMEASDEVSSLLRSFRNNGMQVALDDFGTGYSSLSYLKKFDIDYFKIDQTFIRNLASDSSDMALCEAMIVMAHKLGIKVIAEGVETEQQRNLLKQIECDYGQGYLFSRPVPAEEFEKLFDKV